MVKRQGTSTEGAQSSTRTRVFCSGCNQEITEINYFSNEDGAWCDICFETENPREMKGGKQ
jgi:hypothetical protein